MQRRQIVEDDFLRQNVGIVVVDGLDTQEREVAFVFLGRPNLAGDDAAGAQAEAANLAWRDVDVVGAGKIIVVGASQKAEAVGQDFERPFAEHQAILLDPFLEDFEDEVLFLEAAVIARAFLLWRS